MLLLRIEKSRFKWFGHVSRIPPKRLPKQLPKQMEKDPLDDLEIDGTTTLRIYTGIAWDFTQAK